MRISDRFTTLRARMRSNVSKEMATTGRRAPQARCRSKCPSRSCTTGSRKSTISRGTFTAANVAAQVLKAAN
jgi:hypothetical protein